MDEIVRQNLSRLAKHLGIGDPTTAKLLFIGVEQGGACEDLCSQKEQDPEFVKWRPLEKKNKAWSPVWTKITRVSSNVRGYANQIKYRETELFQKDSFEILTDLFPLSKPRKGDWQSYKDVLQRSEYQDWLVENIEEGYKRIRSVQTSMRNRIATICFGKANWADHIQCLELDGIPNTSLGEGRDKFIVYIDVRTILAPFFGNGAIKNAVLDRIALEIKKFEQSN